MDVSKVYKKDKIILHFSLENCAGRSTYKILFYIEDDYFETEEKKNKIENGTIKFTKIIEYEYDFSKIQKIKFTLQRWHGTKYKSIQDSQESNYTLSSILASQNSVFKVRASNYLKDHEILVISAENPNYKENNHIKNFLFVDYIKAGLKFDSYICIDFSDRKDHNTSLKENQFLQAIQGFTDTLKDYVKVYNVFGYGARSINNSEGLEGKKYFNLNLELNPEIKGYDNIFLKYRDFLYKMNPEKKGFLSHVYERIRKMILERFAEDRYNIIFLLINDKPSEDDLEKCIDYLIEFSILPVSIVTILIGDKSEEEIKGIKFYFSNKRLMSKKDKNKVRNNICFYSMKNCNFNNEILKNKCLRDIPEQVLDYYKFNQKKPSDINKVNSNNKEIQKAKNKDKDDNNFNILNQENIEEGSLDDCCAPNVFGQINNINENKEDNNENIKIEDKAKDNVKNNNFFYKNTPGNENDYNINSNNNNFNNINNLIVKENPFKEKKLINETSNPDNFKKNFKIENPFKSKPKQEEKKYINEININIKNNNNNFINNNNKYVNETDDGNHPKKQIVINPFQKKNIEKEKEEKKYENTPNPEEMQNFQEQKKMRVINPFKSNKKEEPNNKKYINETPGNNNNINDKKIIINNPFQKKNKDNEIKEDKEDKKDENKKINKIGAHFKRRDINISKFSTKSSNYDNVNNYDNEYKRNNNINDYYSLD